MKKRVVVTREDLIRGMEDSIFAPKVSYKNKILTFYGQELPETIDLEAEVIEEYEHDWLQDNSDLYKLRCKKCIILFDDLKSLQKQPKLLAPALWKYKDWEWLVTNSLYSSKEEAEQSLKEVKLTGVAAHKVIWPAIPNSQTGFYRVEE